jgi:cell division protease FtsH
MKENNIKKTGDKEQAGDKKPKNKGRLPSKFNPIYYIYGIAILIFLALQFFGSGGDPVETSWREVKNTMLKEGDISKIIVINRERAEVFIKSDSYEKYKDRLSEGIGAPARTGPHYYFVIGAVETFEANLEKAQSQLSEDNRIELMYETRRDIFTDVLSYILPILLLVGIYWWIIRRMSRGAGGGGSSIFNVGKSQAKIFDKDAHVSTSFKDIAGLAEAKQEIEEIVEFLKNPDRYTKLGGKIPKGALLVGPPGTGKTLLARAVAGEADVPFFSMSGSDFVEMFVGVGASRVRDLFKQAKEKAPCIVFIDEIDAIGRARGKNPNMGANDERENTLNQLLTEMDGFDTNSGVIILAATNRADILDRALMRAGRFDRQIHVELPDLNERREIFMVHLRPLLLSENVKPGFLAKQTPGFSGADIANVCNEAALIAARKRKEKVEKQDFLDAVDRIIGGLEKKNKIISQNEKATIAYHEAGHATVSWLLEYAHPLVKVTIVPRGKALGAAWYLPEERQISTREQILDEVCSSLGGRAAEELIFNTISSGAQNDLEKVTKTAYAMICYFGMSEKVGNVSYYDSSGQSDFSFNRPYSEKTAEMIDAEIKILIDTSYKRAKDILKKNAEGHKKLAVLLLEKEVIFSGDLEEIFGPRPWDKKKDEDEDEDEESINNNNIDESTNEDSSKSESKEDTTKDKETA